MMRILLCLMAFLSLPLLGQANTIPISNIVQAGDLFFLSGQVGAVTEKDGTKHVVKESIATETEQVFTNLQKVLKTQGLSLKNIVHCTVYLTDVNDWATINKTYEKYFPNGHYPARNSLATSGLVFGAHVEFSCIASKKLPIASGAVSF